MKVLAEATSKNDVNAFRTEFSKGFDSKAFNSLDEQAEVTILHAAAINGQNEILTILLDSGIKVDLRTRDDSTPLLAAAYADRVETVKLLLSRGANANAIGHFSLKNVSGQTPLIIASFGGYIQTVQALLEGGADVDQPAGTISPIEAAALSNHYEVVKLLLSKGARVNSLLPKFIAERGNAQVAALLWVRYVRNQR